MALSAPLLVSLLLLAAAACPARGARAWVPERLLQQGGSPESSGANGAESKPEPIGVIQGPTYGGGGGTAAAPAAETPSSPYRFADVGSGSAADVQAAIAAGNAAGFAAAVAAAGPEAAGRWAGVMSMDAGVLLMPPCRRHAKLHVCHAS